LTIVAPLAALCLLLGVYPQPVLRTMEPDLRAVADIADRARARAAGAPTPVAHRMTNDEIPNDERRTNTE
jgi:hypothetical protein